MHQPAIDGAIPGMTKSESAEPRELRRRSRLLEKEDELLCPTIADLPQTYPPEKWLYPLVNDLAADGAPLR